MDAGALMWAAFAAAGGLVGWFFGQRSASKYAGRASSAEGQLLSLQQRLDQLDGELKATRQQASASALAEARAVAEKQSAESLATQAELSKTLLLNESKGLREKLDLAQAEKSRLGAQHSAFETRVAALQDELVRQRTWVEEQGQHLKSLFAKTADDLLQAKAAQFGQQNREQIELLMNPFKSQLSDFRQRVDELHTADVHDRAMLQQQISQLAGKASEIGLKADNLANAMLGNVKKQGNWGELQLKVLLEQAGFVEGRHFRTQYAVEGENEENRFSDTVLFLPNDECLVIDSKLTLASWTEYCSTDDPEQRKGALLAVVASMRKHYQDLAGKDYAHIVSKGRSVPFTLMFVPIEAAGIEAFRVSPELFNEAQKKKIVMVTPTTLFAVLQLVSGLWSIHNRQLNADRIADEGRKLLRKLGTFLESFSSVGASLDKALVSYNEAKGQLHTGKGNLLAIAAKMSDLGVDAPKGGQFERLIAEQPAGDEPS